MPASRTLSSFARHTPRCIDTSLEKLTCTSQGVTDIDIHPAALATLTAHASAEVMAQVRDYLAALPALPSTPPSAVVRPTLTDSTVMLSSSSSSPSFSSSRLRQPQETARHSSRSQKGEEEDAYFNIAIALSVHTVLLSRNKLTRLVGIVQFKSVVRLSLLGNHIRRIEDCEPLGLLPQLAFLSLEFNPVCALPHYRAHLLRITSWPKELSLRNCRLRKLDAKTVSPHDINHGIVCLQREMSLLPELTQRLRLVSFLSHVERTMRLHQEMRRRGVLVHDTETAVTLPLVLERCSSAALEVVDFAAAAHMTRSLVAELQRQQQQQEDHKQRRDSAGKDSVATRADRPANAKVDQKSGEAADDVVVVATQAPGKVETAPSTSCLDVSVETRTSENGRTVVSVLDDVSEICLEDLSWAKLSLSNAEQSLHDAVCAEWSADRFRATLSSLDIKICTHLLRTARMLGQTLGSSDVDDFCRIWLHILSHYEPASTNDNANATGQPRKRPFTVRLGGAGPSRNAATATSARQVPPSLPEEPAVLPLKSATKTTRPRETLVEVRADDSPSDATPDSLSQVSSISATGVRDRNEQVGPGISDTVGGTAARGLCETASSSAHPRRPQPHTDFQLRKEVAVGGSEDGDPATSSRPSSARSDISPRRSIPQATALSSTRHPSRGAALPSRRGVPLPEKDKSLRDASALSPCPDSSSSFRTAHPAPSDAQARETSTQTSRREQAERSQEVAVDMFVRRQEREVKRRTFQELIAVSRRRQQERQCAQYRADKLVSCNGELASLRDLDLLGSISYISRKGVFFHHWRERAMERALFRDSCRRRVLRTWHRHSIEQRAAGAVHALQCQHRKASVLLRWKNRASQAVRQRCAEARQRLEAARGSNAARDASSPEPKAPQPIGVLPFNLSPLKHALSGDGSWPPAPATGTGTTTSVTSGESPTGLSPIETVTDLSPAPRRDGVSEELHLSPPPLLDDLLAKARPTRTSSLSTGAVVMSIASSSSSLLARHRQRGATATRQQTETAPSDGTSRHRSPSTGLVRSPACHGVPRSRSTTPPPPPSSSSQASPFSEDDVAALVEKASALRSSRDILVRRVAELQAECQQTHLLRTRAEAEATQAKDKLRACQESLLQCETERDSLGEQVKHLKRCVGVLREERRGWLGQVLTYRKREKCPFHLNS